SYLLDAAQDGKVGDRVGEDGVALQRDAGRDAREVLFRYTDVEKAPGKTRGEVFGDAEAEITDQQKHARVLFGQRHQSAHKRFSHGRDSSSATARDISSASGVR